jgi:hypothetical protein
VIEKFQALQNKWQIRQYHRSQRRETEEKQQD